MPTIYCPTLLWLPKHSYPTEMGILTTTGRSVRPSLAGQDAWRQEMKTAIRDPAELCDVLRLDESFVEPARRAAALFGLFAPRGFVARMQRGDPCDPLLRQVLPLGEELLEAPGYSHDPVGDLSARVDRGLLKKYAGRALLISTGACAVHCRYCFRRHFPYSEAPRSLEQLEPALDAIAADSSIEEIILSGGDPLTLGDEYLAALAQRLAAISHITRLRVHTRLPIIIPRRVTPELLDGLTATRLMPVVVIHANHAHEIDEEVEAALQQLNGAGVMLLNQAVLLRGVNDNEDALFDLSQRLVACRVLPYYLHQLDRVSGAAHFEVPAERGRELIEALRRRLPGYAVPRYVQEIAGEAGKQVIA